MRGTDQQSKTWRRKIVLALSLVACFSMVAEIASAQQYGERRTLLDMLFGPREPRYVEPPPMPRKQVKIPRARKKPTSTSITTITTTAAPAPPPPVAKLENARKVLVIGDFMADGLADGLRDAFAASPGVVIEKRSNGSSGLVRDDYYDWHTQLPAILDEVKPTLVVIEIGANDRQQIETAAGKLDFRTDDWFKEYERRITQLGATIKQRQLPLIWVGLPAFRPQNMTADALTLNRVYRSAAEKIGAEFVDVWDGFVDQDGRFIVTGSDINGQQVRLRGTDGIGLTASGKRKLAFYVEKPARRHLGDMTSPDLVRLDAGNLPVLLDLPPAETQNLVRTQPIDLFDPELDGASELLGATPLPVASIPSPREQLVRNGVLPPPPAGRVDDLRIPSTGSTQP